MNLEFDPEIDTPATVAIVGGGPVGVEAALYARFLGYSVLVFEAAKVGDRQLAWGAVPMPGPWSEVTSALGRAALEAQGSTGGWTSADVVPNHRQFVEEYLLPLARTDLLYDSMHIHAPVISVSRTGCADAAQATAQRRAEQEFRVLIESQQRGQFSQLVDIVLDCSGLQTGRGLASGGGMAVGESRLAEEILPGKVDVLGKRRQQLADRHTLLFGRDASAIGNALDFTELIAQSPQTRLTWIVPKDIATRDPLDLPAPAVGPAAERLGELLANRYPGVVCLPAWGIESLQQHDRGWSVRVQVGEEETLDLQAESLINCRTPRADWSFIAGLQLPGSIRDDGVSLEPHYYVLGEKGLGRPLSMVAAREQIRRAFALIGGRGDLDLYATIAQHSLGTRK